MQIVYRTEFYCEICGGKRPFNVWGDGSINFDRESNEYKEEVLEWGKHFHWTDNHRLCAVCGKYVKSGDLDVAVNDGSIEIHKDYTDEYKKVEQGNRFGHLLIVHPRCIEGGEL